MYELVHTSLPNGLMPGTHGFATAAMTRNLPDSLRSRLEMLSAYTHRTGAHDETYFRENPVNWQHLVVPFVGHVVSRIVASPFDHTGRTNRLARHLCLEASEMGTNGAVRLAELAGEVLTAPWEGDARWLDEKVSLAMRVRADRSAPPATSAPHWERLCGRENGLDMARRVARFVQSNLHVQDASLYFRTDTARDAEGTELLGLFGDVIALLPSDVRGEVTFSTYAVDLPVGIPCLLRGIYDDTAVFQFVASSGRPYVDCRAGRVAHAEGLPPLESVEVPSVSERTRREQSALQRALAKSVSVRPATSSTPSGPSVAVGATSVCKNAPWWIGLIVGLVASLAVIALTLYGACAYLKRKQDPAAQAALQRQEEGVATTKRIPVQKEVEPQPVAKPTAPTLIVEREPPSTSPSETRKKEPAPQKSLPMSSYAEILKRKRGKGGDPLAAAYTNYVGSIRWGRPNVDNPEDCACFKGDGTGYVYWMNDCAQMERQSCFVSERENKAARRTIRRLVPDPRTPFWGKSPFVLWYSIGKRRLYWQWNEIDVSFQNTNDVEQIWQRLTCGQQTLQALLCKRKISYRLISEDGDKEEMEVGPFRILPDGTGKTLSIKEVLTSILNSRYPSGQAPKAADRKRQGELEHELKQNQVRLEQLQERQRVLTRKEKQCRGIDEQLRALNKTPKKNSGEESKLREQRNLVKKDVEELTAKVSKIPHLKKTIRDLEREIRSLQEKNDPTAVQRRQLDLILGRRFHLHVEMEDGR